MMMQAGLVNLLQQREEALLGPTEKSPISPQKSPI